MTLKKKKSHLKNGTNGYGCITWRSCLNSMQNYHFTINFQEKCIIHFLEYMPCPATSRSDVQWNVSHCPTQELNRAHGLPLSPDCLASVWYSTSSLESFAMSFSFIMVAHYQRWPWPSLAVISGWLETIHLLVSHHVWTLSLHVWRGVHHPTPDRVGCPAAGMIASLS